MIFAFSSRFFDESDGGNEGSRVKSTDCPLSQRRQYCVHVIHTARIHQPVSNSCRTILLFSVSTESTGWPSENVLPTFSSELAIANMT